MRTGRRRLPHPRMAARLAGIGVLLVVYGALAIGVLSIGPPAAFATGRPAAPLATNGFGPGLGTQSPTRHWGGAYTLAGVPGYAYCIDPGYADPFQLPDDQWSPIAYPGSSVYSDGEMAALAYFAERYQGAGYPGWSVDDTVAAIEQVAYASAGGTTPSTGQGPSALVALIKQYMVTYEGPWTISLSMSPASGSTFDSGTNYGGTITVTSATGNGVGGLELSAPATGGPEAGQLSNFVWLAGTTNAAGQISFQWNISGIPPEGQFSAEGISVAGNAVGSAPPAYAPPAGSGGQLMMVSGASEVLGTGFSGDVQQNQVETGTISIQKSVPDGAYYGPAGAQFEIENGSGEVLDTLTTDTSGSTTFSTPLTATTAGTQYRVHETVAPPGYGLAADQVVTVYPSQDTVASFTGADEEPALPAQLGVAKIDAQTNQPLAGATFAFAFDTADDGVYDQQLGSCTTGQTGTCQPPVENTTGGWLAGWYQVTETAAPPGYWLDPATATQAVYVLPGTTNVASVTFGDDLLGSLQLSKSGNDTAYWPVTGARFTVTGPAPSPATVGTLTVATGDLTNTLTGLVPGTYEVSETTPPPGYTASPPFSVAVAAGHTTTTTSVADPVQPGTITITKTDAATGDPLAGATFDVRYDSTDDGTYDQDLGDCTTNVSGTCSPPTNDGTGYLPGDYQVTEISAPPGYFLPAPDPSQTITVTPAGTADASFQDHLLVPATFQKVVTGNYDPTQLILAGAVIDVTAGTAYGGATVATCTTGATGACTTASSLVSGQRYCWEEVTPPPGLAAGAGGCFTATNSQGAQPITVTDPGLFVGIAVKKVDAASPGTVLAGATFDLYRVDGGTGPDSPTPAPGAPTEPGQTWVARATTDSGGEATFPLQFPGYAYCLVEHQAPANYVLDTAEHCTGVLQGTTQTPAPVTTVTVADSEAQVTVSAHKFNSTVPDTGIPGALYDLYVEGQGPPSGPPSSPRPGTDTEPGDTWWAEGTTDSEGDLSFTVPAGYAWCFHEVAAPTDYDLDPALHCTAVLTAGSPATSTTVALPETLATVYLSARKYNSQHPDTVIPGATYELLVDGSIPPGYDPPPAPPGVPVPDGDAYWTEGTTGPDGLLSFAVPAGSRWCLHEVVAPSGYEPDTSFHCTAVLTSDTPTAPVTVALPEVPVPPAPPVLAFTGGPGLPVVGGGLVLMASGGLLWFLGRRRRHGEGPRAPGRPRGHGHGSGPSRAGRRRSAVKRTGAAVLVLTVVTTALAAGHPHVASAATHPAVLTTTCPGPQCPYTPPTPDEQGAASDVLARMNLERSAPQRDYVYNGIETQLAPLVPTATSAEETAQAAAEWEATNNTVADYGGADPVGYDYTTASNAADAGDSAGIDNGIMHSYGHALGVLSAAPTQVAVGAACSAGGTLYVTEDFYDTSETSAVAGQARFKAELSENNVYVQSGGKITTVTDTEGTGPAQDYLPQQPIVAGYGTDFDEVYATGADWSCAGVRYPPGSAPTSPLPGPVTGIAASPSGGGYALVDSQGAISIHGDASFHGAANGLNLVQPIDHIVETPDGGGYWLVAADGGVFTYGDARFYGSMGGKPLNAPVVGLAPTPDGGGYWLVAADGGVFSFGDAMFHGSMGGRHLNAPVVGITANQSGTGYRLVAADGGVFSFGAPFYGSTGGMVLNKPVVGMADTPDGGGYWLVAADGGIFSFGDARFHGSTGGITLNKPVVGMAVDPATDGYWLVAGDGGVFSFDAPFYGAD